MIQRIQSVYLGLAAVALTGMLSTGVVFGSGPYTLWGTLTSAVLAILAAVGAIFMYSVRHKQRMVVVMAQLCTLLAAVILCGTLYLDDELYVHTHAGLEWDRLLTVTLPLCAYVLLILARRAITRDIKLVRSIDRLR